MKALKRDLAAHTTATRSAMVTTEKKLNQEIQLVRSELSEKLDAILEALKAK